MKLNVENYVKQTKRWPEQGKHILAQYTDDYVVVYQAYRSEIGHFAVKHQFLGGAFSYSRMSWIKPNFLWMMYRSGWGTKEGQEVTLALYFTREFFTHIVMNAYPSTNLLGIKKSTWDLNISKSDVRLQWDPDHDPLGAPVARKAIQLGLRKGFLEPFKGEGLIKIEDVSRFVADQRTVLQQGRIEDLITPKEDVLEVDDVTRKMLFMEDRLSDEDD